MSRPLAVAPAWQAQVRALTFLFVRTLVNGIKRAVSSPKRLIGVLFFLGYYWFLFLRPYENIGRRRTPTPDIKVAPGSIHLPDLGVLDASIFGFFAVCAILISPTLFAARGSFKPADVDVLFTTPISPKIVLAFRFLRTYLFALIFPLFIAVFIGQSAARQLFASLRNLAPEAIPYAVRGGVVFAISVFMTTSLGFAISLLAERSDKRGIEAVRWLKRAIVFCALVSVSIFALVVWSDPSGEGVIAALHLLPIRILLFLSWAATQAVMGGVSGILSGFFLVALGTFGLWGAFRQAEWMYDAAATQGGGPGATTRELMRTNNVVAIREQQARLGKIKRDRLSARMAQIDARGGFAILWREVVIQLRLKGAWSLVIMSLMIAGGAYILTLPVSRKSLIPVYLYMGGSLYFIGLIAFATAMMSFIEVLRKVELTKALPFSPSQVVRWEVVAKSLNGVLLAIFFYIFGLAVRPDAWELMLTGLILLPTLVIMTTATSFLVAALFPDFEDPTQRGFRGLMNLLGVLITVGPFLVFPVGAIFLKVSPLAAVPFSLAIGAVITVGAILWSGQLYADYNPSE